MMRDIPLFCVCCRTWYVPVGSPMTQQLYPYSMPQNTYLGASPSAEGMVQPTNPKLCLALRLAIATLVV